MRFRKRMRAFYGSLQGVLSFCGLKPQEADTKPHGVLNLGLKPQTQRAQYPLSKEYTLNHNIRAPIILKGVFLN